MGAEVIQFGSAWDEANMKVLEFCTNSINSAYISPFEDPSIWFVLTVVLLLIIKKQIYLKVW